MAYKLPDPIPYTGDYQMRLYRDDNDDAFNLTATLAAGPYHSTARDGSAAVSTVNLTETIYPSRPSRPSPPPPRPPPQWDSYAGAYVQPSGYGSGGYGSQDGGPHHGSGYGYHGNEQQEPLMSRPQKLMGTDGSYFELPALEAAKAVQLIEQRSNNIMDALAELLNSGAAKQFEVIDPSKGPILCTEEQVGYIARNCCPASIRGSNVELKAVTRHGGEGRLIGRLERSCCGSTMYLTDARGKRVGNVHSAMSCLKIKMTVSDNLRERYVIEGSKMSPGIMLTKLPFGPCASVAFTVRSSRSGEAIGSITNDWSGMVRECSTDANDYSIEFSNSGSSQLPVVDKLLLVSAAYLADALYFTRRLSKSQLLLVAIMVGLSAFMYRSPDRFPAVHHHRPHPVPPHY